jgi:hypothetical protein
LEWNESTFEWDESTWAVDESVSGEFGLLSCHVILVASGSQVLSCALVFGSINGVLQDCLSFCHARHLNWPVFAPEWVDGGRGALDHAAVLFSRGLAAGAGEEFSYSREFRMSLLTSSATGDSSVLRSSRGHETHSVFFTETI